ncbi:MAG TPA: SusC/RagA family TonB-linked outer membrane protein [Gemmatimonadaceae bacterium]
MTLLVPAAVHAQGSITGRVTASGNNEALPDARVMVVSSTASAVTNAEGRYTLRNVPNGTIEIRVLRVGYQEQKKSVTVSGTAPVTLDFTLAQAVVKLQEVVTTATGEQRRVELGHAIQNLGDISKKVEEAPITNLTDLMAGKAPGVVVLPGNMTGAAPTVRIRGIKSISLSSSPIYVVDGVRMAADAINIGTGGTTVSLLNTLNPDEVEDIEIVKGPSAATLYGTDAANGVIVITTKKGRAGASRWTWHGEEGVVKDRNKYPSTYAMWGHAPATPTTPTRCILQTVASGACVHDSTTEYNLLSDPDYSPITGGNRRSYGGQVSGGTDQVRFFISGDLENEIGPLKMPAFSRNFLESSGTELRDEWVYPERFGRNSFRANVNAAVNPKFDLAVNAGYTKTDQRLPQVDNNTFSYLYNAFQSPGFKPTATCRTNSVACLGYTNVGGLNEELGGYGFYTPANLFQVLRNLDVDRFMTSANAQWRPFTWLQNDATIGMDQAQRDQFSLCRLNECPASGTTRQGSVTDQRTADRNLSAKIVSTASWQGRSSLNLKTTVGVDYVNQQTEFSQASATQLPPGAQAAGQGAVKNASSSLPRADKTLGYYAQEQISVRDRLFVTIATRTDQNSAFGTSFQRVFYPKASVSYIISDEPFFPKIGFLNQVRLRGAYGASGVQPGSTTALQTYSAVTVNSITTPTATSGTDSPGIVANDLGNVNLKPERSTEREFGFETQMFTNRVHFEYTYYNNLTKDALIEKPIAASAGSSSLTRTENLGSVRNTGHEATITTTLLDRRNFGWDVTIGGSHNTNQIESLGFQDCVVAASDPTCVDGKKPNPTIGTGANRDSLGKPIRGVYARPYRYSDANNNGIIESSEVKVDPNFAFLGYAVPRDLVTVQSGFELLRRKLRINVSLDYKGGFSLFNNTSSFYCQQTNFCYDETHKEAPLADQARQVALRYGSPSTSIGYWENGQFWRLREVGATLTMPEQLARRIRARNASLTLSGRNLKVWTAYKGTDPESGYGTGNVQSDFSTTAPPTYFTMRVNLHY